MTSTTIIKKLLKNPLDYANSISVKKLVNVLELLSYEYYNTGVSLVPDRVYDLLRNILEERDEHHPFLKVVGAPIIKDKVKLPYHMASLDKIKPDTGNLAKWVKRYKGPYVLSDKLDGVSALLVKGDDGDDSLKLYTRGDGVMGQDISHLISHVLPQSVKIDKMPPGATIRGELLITKENFKLINKKNARNTVAGLVNAKRYNQATANLTDFVAYNVLSPKTKQSKQLKNIKTWGFKVVNNVRLKTLSNEHLSEYLITRRAECEYEIDGIVVVDDSKSYSHTTKNPKHGFAFKTILTDQVAEVTVLDVVWDISKYGYLKPRIRIEPITITNVEIQYATGHNAAYIYDNNLGPGSVIKLVRSGDVIPYISKVLQPSASGEPKMPDTPYEWNKSEVDVISTVTSGPLYNTMIAKKINSFFEKMKVRHISLGIIKKLVNNGYNTLTKVIIAGENRDKLYEISGLGKKIIDKLYKGLVAALRVVTLTQLMAASGVFGMGFGMRKLSVVVKAYPNILINKWDTKAITKRVLELPGFDILTATKFAKGFKLFKKFYIELNKVVDISHLKQVVRPESQSDIGTLFTDQKIVFTGFRNDKLKQFIESNGGKVTTSVSGKTTLLIFNPDTPTSSKITKAKKLDIPTIPLNEFMRKHNI